VSNESESVRSDDGRGFVQWPHRYSVVLTCSVGMFIAFVDRVNISVAALAMQEDLGWTDSVKGVVLASFFGGYMATQVLGGWLSHRYGGERVLLFSLIGWSICVLLTPIAAYLWLPLLIVMRIGLGVGEGPLNPAAFSVFGMILPPTERTRAVAIYAGAGYLGTLVALVSTGALVARFGWESVFYVWGILGVVFAFVAIKVLIPEGQSLWRVDQETVAASEENPIPWRRLLGMRPFWALMVTFFCTCWIFYVLLLWMPSYFATAHGVEINRTGIYSVSPWIVMLIFMNVAGWVSDALLAKGVGSTVIRKTLTGVGLFGTCAMLLAVRTAGSPEIALALLCTTLAFLALAYASQVPNVFDLAPQHAGVMFGILNTVGSLPGLIGIAVTGVLVDVTGSFDGSLVLAGGLAVFGGIVYVLFGTGKQLISD